MNMTLDQGRTHEPAPFDAPIHFFSLGENIPASVIESQVGTTPVCLYIT